MKKSPRPLLLFIFLAGILTACSPYEQPAAIQDVAANVPSAIATTEPTQSPSAIPPTPTMPVATQTVNYKDIIFQIEGTPVTLVNGLAEIEAAPGSASKITTRYFGNEAQGDLNGDGHPDVAFLIMHEGGGSGVFFYVVAALWTENGYIGTNGVPLGDRIAPQTTHIEGDQVVVNYADRNPGEPYTVSPSVGVSKYFVIKNGELEDVTLSS